MAKNQKGMEAIKSAVSKTTSKIVKKVASTAAKKINGTTQQKSSTKTRITHALSALSNLRTDETDETNTGLKFPDLFTRDETNADLKFPDLFTRDDTDDASDASQMTTMEKIKHQNAEDLSAGVDSNHVISVPSLTSATTVEYDLSTDNLLKEYYAASGEEKVDMLVKLIVKYFDDDDLTQKLIADLTPEEKELWEQKGEESMDIITKSLTADEETEKTVVSGPRAPGAFATTHNSVDRAAEVAEDEAHETAKEEAVSIDEWTDNPYIGAGQTYVQGRMTPNEQKEYEENKATAEEYQATAVKYWDYLTPEEKYEEVLNMAGVLNLDDVENFDEVYAAATEEQKVELLAAAMYRTGSTDEILAMKDDLTPEGQEMLHDTIISAFGDDGEEMLDEYYEALSDQREIEFEQEWAAEHGTNYIGEKLDEGVRGIVAYPETYFGLIAADVATDDREITSPWEGVTDPWAIETDGDAHSIHIGIYGDGDALTNVSTVVNNFTNYFLWTLENDFATMLKMHTADETEEEELKQDFADYFVDWGTSVAEDYWNDVYMTEIKADAAGIEGIERGAGEIINNVSTMIPSIALYTINPALGLATFGTSAAGQYARQAYDSGASLTDAVTYGTMMGLVEVGTEKMFTGFGYFGRGAFNTLASKTGIKALSKETLSVLNDFKTSPWGQALTFFTHAGAEASEEMVSQVFQSYMQRATYDPDAQNATMQEILAAGGMGAIVSGILGIPVTVKNVSAATSTTAAKNTIESQIQDNVAAKIKDIEAQLSTGEITAAEAKYSIEEIMQSAQLSIDQLQGKGSLSTASQTKENKTVSKTMPVATSASEAMEMMKILAKDKKAGDTVSVAFTDNGQVKIYTASVGEYGINAPSVRNANSTEAEEINAKTEALSGATGETRTSGIQNNVADHIISLAEYLSENTGKKVKFISEAAYEKNGASYTKNGEELNDTIYINAESKNPASQIFGHELTHSLEKYQKQYDYLKKTVFDWYKSSLETERAKVFGIYSRAGVELKSVDDIDSEIMARFVEKKLLADEDTIRSVVKANRSLAQRILDWLNDTIQRLLGTPEQKFLVEARNMYRKLLDTDRAARAKAEKTENVREKAENVTEKGKTVREDTESVREKAETEQEKEKTSGEDVKYSVEEQKDIRHIKEQLVDNLDVVNDMEPVANVNVDTSSKNFIEKVIADVKKKGYEVDRENFGIIKFGEKQIRKGWRYMNTDAESAAFLAVRDVLKRGIEITQRADHKDRRYQSVTFAAPVILNGKRGNLAVSVIKTKGNIYKAHRILLPDGNVFILDKTESTELTHDEGGQNAVFSSISSVPDTTISQGSEGVKGEDKGKYSITEEEDSQYMEAVESGDMDTAQKMVDDFAAEWAKNSKIRDEDGKLIRVYHGTMEDFTVFDRTKGRANMDIQGNFFSPWKEDAVGYGTNVKAYYLNITNPATESVGYSALKKHTGENNAGISARDDLIAKGYNGVNNNDEEYIAFDSNQIKSADPVTYDNEGNVIPLSERFNKSEEDIRYSITEDSEGRTLTEDQQEFFKDSKVVDEKGRLLVMYHSTDAEGIDKFQSGNSSGLIYFATTPSAAKTAARGKRNIIKAYLNANKPVNSEKKSVPWYEAEDSLKVSKWRREGYDSVYVKDESGISIAVFYPNQIKSVDNLHPTENEDIRYSIEEEQTSPEMQSILNDFDKNYTPKAQQKVSMVPVVSRVLKNPIPYLYENKKYGEWTGRSYSEGYTHKLEFKWADDGRKEWLNEAELIQKIKNHEAKESRDKPEDFYVPGDEVYLGRDKVIIDTGKKIAEGHMYTVEYEDGIKVAVNGSKLSVVPSNGSAVLQGLKAADVEVKDQLQNVIKGLKQDLGYRTKGRKELNDLLASTVQKIMIRGFYNPSDVEKLLDSAYETGIETQPLDEIQQAAKDHLRDTRIYVTDDLRGEMESYGGMAKINRQMFGNKTRLVVQREGSVGLDELYSELNALYPDLFPETTDPSAQISLIIDAATAKRQEKSFERIDDELLREGVPPESTIKATMEQNIKDAYQQLSSLYDQANTELDNYREIPPANSEPEEYPDFQDLREEDRVEWEDPPEEWDVVDGYEDMAEMEPPPEEEEEINYLPGNERVINANKPNPLETSEFREMREEFGEQMRERTEEELEMDWQWVRKLRANDHQGINYSKHYARNFDAAAHNDTYLRKKLKETFEDPFVRSKSKYINAVEKMTNDLYDVTHELGIKMGSKEDEAIQKYGEGYYTKPQKAVDMATKQKYIKNVKVKYTLDDLKKECPSTWEKVVKADEYFRRIYDEYIPLINEARAEIYGNVREVHRQQMVEAQNKIDFLKHQLQEVNKKRESINTTIASKKELLKTVKTAKARDTLEKSIRYNEERLLSVKENIKKYRDDIGYQKSKMRTLKEQERSGEYLKNKMLIPKKDYYHHMRKEASFLKDVLSIGRNSSEIDPMMEGLSEYTMPRSKWASILARQGKGEYKLTAIESMLEYIQAAEYMIHMDPTIAKFRDDIQAMAQATQDTRNANKLLQWLTNWTNDLAGKTNFIDRWVQNGLGRDRMRYLRKINGIAKSNAVVGNINSAAIQFSNLPNGFKYIKSPKSWTRGSEIYLEWLHGQSAARELVRQSTFLNERYIDRTFSRFEEKWFQQPKKLALWALSAGDEQSSVLIWCAAYDDAVHKGEKNPVEYADDITMRSVAGRGIGEVPITQKALPTQVLAPFQVEVNNLWQLYKETTSEIFKGKGIKKKASALDGLARLLVGSFMLNNVTDMVIGRRVLPDFIYVLWQCIEEWMTGDDDDDKNWGDRFIELTGRELGELLSSMPYGALIAYYLINSQWDRTEIFGEDYDPTRYGVGSIVAEWFVDFGSDFATGDNIADDILSFFTTFVTPWGGRQIERIINGLENLGLMPKIEIKRDGILPTDIDIQTQPTAGYYDDSGNLKFPMETFADDPWQAFVGLVFGQYATEAGQDYLENDYSSLNDRETDAFNDLVENGADPWEVYDTIRAMKECSTDDEKRNVLIASDLTDDEKYGLYMNVVIDSDAAENEMERINSIVGSGASFDEYLEYRSQSSDLTSLSELIAAGLDSDTAADVNDVLSSIEPLEGEDSVTSMQKWEAIADMDLTEEEKAAAMSTVMTESQYKAYSVGTEYGLTAETYVDYKNALAEANEDGNSNYSQAETKAAIDSLDVSTTTKATLWQMTNKNWSAENNPYDTAVSAEVKEKLNSDDEDPKDTEDKDDSEMCPLAGEYYVSSGYGYRDVSVGSTYHQAVDLACDVGTPVTSVKSGTVTSITNSSTGYGLSIEITDEDGNVEKYSHLSTVGYEVGDTVTAGTQIAESGNTGTTTGPHLDFKYMKDGQWVDPSLYFNITGGSGTSTATGEYTSQEVATGGSSASSSGGGSGSGSSSGTVSTSDRYEATVTAADNETTDESTGSTQVASSATSGGIVLPTAAEYEKLATERSTQTSATGATQATAATAATAPTLESILSGMTGYTWS